MIARRLVVSGRVQGVGYRAAMTEAAHAAGITGWVQNRQDGTVEALLQGKVDAVERMLAWCRRGPPGARVTTVTHDGLEVDPAIMAFVSRPTE